MMMGDPSIERSRDPGLAGDAAFAKLAEFLEDRTGIVLSNGKRRIAASRLSRHLKRLGLSGFDAYCDHLNGPDGADELQHMITSLTTNVTRFFRESHHFDALKAVLLSRIAQSPRIRMWSAGCSSGEEAYSMAMVVRDALPQSDDLDVKILGTDIDADVLQRARSARYSSSLYDQIEHPLLQKYTRPCADEPNMFEVCPEVRSLVQFAQLNLVDPWPMQGQFDAIFCRNVVIYFSAQTQASLWPRFATALRPGAPLMIGHSERVTGPGSEQLKSSGVTQYRRIS